MTLIQDAIHELNGRTRGFEARIQRLKDAGWPTERAALRQRLGREQDAEHEASGGVYHCCTVRTSNGCDPDLPERNRIGCRIERVPIVATLVNNELGDEPSWLVTYGSVGPGFMETVFVPFAKDGDGEFECATPQQAEDLTRRKMLRRADCVATRAEAEVLVREMLDRRAGKQEAGSR